MTDEGIRLLTFNEAAGRLGWAGRWRGLKLKRACFARERETKKRFITRLGSSRMPAYKVTLSALRRAFPELFASKVDTLQANFKNYLLAIDERISERVATHVDEHVEPKFQELWERDERIAGTVDELAKRVAQIARQR